MPSSWFKVNARLWREVLAALERHGEHDLVERVKQSRRPGARKKPALAYRQLLGMWESYRKQHDEGTDEELAYGFIRAHRPKIDKLLGLKIGRKIDPEKGPWETIRKALSRGKQERARGKSRRRSSSQFMRKGFGRQKSKQALDRALDEYLLDQARKALAGEPTGIF